MDAPKPRRRWPIWLAVGLLMILMLLPATGWLIRSQLSAELLVGRLGHPASPDEVAREHPADYLLQQYSAMQPEFELKPEFPGCISFYEDISAKVLPALRALSVRMPDRPGPYATILRFLSGSPKFRIAEPDYFPDAATRRPARRGMSALAPQAVATPEEFAEFDRVAAEGERIDPDNAYFSIMRAAGFYANHRDRDAVSAVLRGGSKSHWDDYATGELKGGFRLDEVIGTSHASLMRMSQFCHVCLPQNSAIRAVSRMTLYRAVKAERKGEFALGIALRHAQMRYGSLMRSQFKGEFGSLMGISMVEMAVGHFPGAPRGKFDNRMTYDRKSLVRQMAYTGYLRGMGRTEEARWVAAEMEAGRQARAIMNEALQRDTLQRSSGVLIALIIYAGFLLSNLVACLVLGAAAHLATRISPWKRAALPRVVLSLGLATCLYLWQGHVLHTDIRSPIFCGFSSDLSSTVFTSGFEETPGLPDTMAHFDGLKETIAYTDLCTPLTLIVPGLTVLGLAIACLILRVPVMAGIGRGLRGFTPPIACGLALTYCGMVIAAGVFNARINTWLDGSVHNACDYSTATKVAWLLGRYSDHAV